MLVWLAVRMQNSASSYEFCRPLSLLVAVIIQDTNKLAHIGLLSTSE